VQAARGQVLTSHFENHWRHIPQAPGAIGPVGVKCQDLTPVVPHPAVVNTADASKVLPQIDEARRQVKQCRAALDVSFVVPEIQLFAILCPVKGDTQELADSPD
jgi:hypothetical protein